MKKKAIYTQAELEVISLLESDVIATSSETWNGWGDNVDPDGWI